MGLLASGRHTLCRLLHSRVVQPGVLQIGQRTFSAEPAPSESDDSITVTVNPFKGHRLAPPSRDVQTNKKELLDMFEVYMLNPTSEDPGIDAGSHSVHKLDVHAVCRPWCA